MKTVLIAQENIDTRVTMKYAFRKKGYIALETGKGDYVLEMVRILHPDLIILDVQLQRMDGVEVLNRIKADPMSRDIPILMLGFSGLNKSILRAVKGQVEAYFDKASLNLLSLLYTADKVMEKTAQPNLSTSGRLEALFATAA